MASVCGKWKSEFLQHVQQCRSCASPFSALVDCFHRICYEFGKDLLAEEEMMMMEERLRLGRSFTDIPCASRESLSLYLRAGFVFDQPSALCEE